MKRKKDEKIDATFRLIIIGDVFVGKTSILSRLKNNTFNEFSTSTLGIDFVKKIIEVDKKTVKL